jgi:hypothetical protein
LKAGGQAVRRAGGQKSTHRPPDRPNA